MSELAVPGGNSNSEKITSGWKLERLERLRRCKEMKRVDMHVAQVLSEAWDSKLGFVRLSYPKIAEKSGYGVRSVKYSVKRLLQNGFLEMRMRGNSKRLANEYYLRMPAELVQKATATSAKTDTQLVQPVAHPPTEVSPTNISLTQELNNKGKESCERSERDGESESSILWRCDRLLQRHSDNPNRLLSRLRRVCSAREILELVSAAVDSGRDVEGELRHVLGERRAYFQPTNRQ
jgi:hypothetical protein